MKKMCGTIGILMKNMRDNGTAAAGRENLQSEAHQTEKCAELLTMEILMKNVRNNWNLLVMKNVRNTGNPNEKCAEQSES